MRISDWSSDVCSSDLVTERGAGEQRQRLRVDLEERAPGSVHGAHALGGEEAVRRGVGSEGKEVGRSEEHTSELQSLMRISYAVFCLKKKKYLITNETALNIYTVQQ